MLHHNSDVSYKMESAINWSKDKAAASNVIWYDKHIQYKKNLDERIEKWDFNNYNI